MVFTKGLMATQFTGILAGAVAGLIMRAAGVYVSAILVFMFANTNTNREAAPQTVTQTTMTPAPSSASPTNAQQRKKLNPHCHKSMPISAYSCPKGEELYIPWSEEDYRR